MPHNSIEDQEPEPWMSAKPPIMELHHMLCPIGEGHTPYPALMPISSTIWKQSRKTPSEQPLLSAYLVDRSLSVGRDVHRGKLEALFADTKCLLQQLEFGVNNLSVGDHGYSGWAEPLPFCSPLNILISSPRITTS